jgi:hypothetical protein
MTPEPKDPKEPIHREEYERRHAALRQSYERFARRSTRILAFLVLVVLATGALSAYLLHENSQQTKEINGSLIDNCKKNGNPLRTAVRRFGTVLIEQVQSDIAQSKTFEKRGVFAEIFPDYPPDKLRALLRSGREDERRKIGGLREAKKQVQPVNCEKRYPSR